MFFFTSTHGLFDPFAQNLTSLRISIPPSSPPMVGESTFPLTRGKEPPIFVIASVAWQSVTRLRDCFRLYSFLAMTPLFRLMTFNLAVQNLTDLRSIKPFKQKKLTFVSIPFRLFPPYWRRIHLVPSRAENAGQLNM